MKPNKRRKTSENPPYSLRTNRELSVRKRQQTTSNLSSIFPTNHDELNAPDKPMSELSRMSHNVPELPESMMLGFSYRPTGKKSNIGRVLGFTNVTGTPKPSNSTMLGFSSVTKRISKTPPVREFSDVTHLRSLPSSLSYNTASISTPHSFFAPQNNTETRIDDRIRSSADIFPTLLDLKPNILIDNNAREAQQLEVEQSVDMLDLREVESQTNQADIFPTLLDLKPDTLIDNSSRETQQLEIQQLIDIFDVGEVESQANPLNFFSTLIDLEPSAEIEDEEPALTVSYHPMVFPFK